MAARKLLSALTNIKLAATVCLATAITTAACAASVTTVTVPTQNPDYASLFVQFDAGFNDGQAYSQTDNTSGTLGWGQSYMQLGYIRMYRATSDTQWLDKIVTQFDRVLNNRDNKRGRIDHYAQKPLNAWGSANYDPQGRWHAFVVHTGMICQGPAEFIRIVKADPALTDKYGPTADRYLTELKAIVAEANRDFRTSGTMGYFEDSSFKTSGIVPLNMGNAMGSVIVELYGITKKPEYKDQATKMASFFKACLQPADNDSYVWEYWPKHPGRPVQHGEDISHAAINVDFAARCYQAGIVFTQRDMEKFANTWQFRVKDSTTSQPVYADFIDGREHPTTTYIPQAAGRWLSILPCLTPHQHRLFFDQIAPAFAGKDLAFPSQALGLANLAWLNPHNHE